MAERKVVTRPWRIEVVFSERWGWCVQSTVSTKERAIEELAYHRRWYSRPVRAKNRETGEVIGADALDQIDTEMGGRVMSRPTFICGGDQGTSRRRGESCPNALHDWPLPIGYTDADLEAHWRLRNRWTNKRCPECKRYGWIPGKLTEAHVRRPMLEVQP